MKRHGGTGDRPGTWFGAYGSLSVFGSRAGGLIDSLGYGTG